MSPSHFMPGKPCLSHPPRLWYGNAGGITQTIAFTGRLENKVLLTRPMFFFNLDPFVVFPGEKITVNLDSTERYVLTVKGNEQRNRELAF